MNQYKLRSLMFHSGFLTEDGGWDNRPIHEQEDNFKRFAQLIVRECLTIVERKEYSYHEADPLWETAQLIKEHFGVEE